MTDDELKFHVYRPKGTDFYALCDSKGEDVMGSYADLNLMKWCAEEYLSDKEKIAVLDAIEKFRLSIR